MRPHSWIGPLAGLAGAVLFPASAGAQTTERVSLNSVGQQGNDPSYDAAISADGRFVAFRSYAGNLVPGDTNAASDVFVHDRQTGITERVSVDSSGLQGNSSSWFPSLSADGRYVAFISRAGNLVPGDTNAASDVFVHDRQTGNTTCVSVSSSGVSGNDASYDPSISADGRYVAFDSRASNFALMDTNADSDVFVHDRQTGQTLRVSVDSAGAQVAGSSGAASISSDGRYVAFDSAAAGLVVGDTNGFRDVFRHDLQTGLTTRISVNTPGGEGNGPSSDPSISADGLFIAFESSAWNLVRHDTNHQDDVFVRDVLAGKTGRVSVDSAGQQGNRGSNDPTISADGRMVAFRSGATDLVPGDLNGSVDVFLHDHQSGKTGRVSLSSAGAEGNDSSYGPALSADGRCVAFYSFAQNLVPGDTNATRDIFVHDLDGGGLRLARSGFCPGPLRLSVTLATPNGLVILAYGPAGSFVKPGSPCQGLRLDISGPNLRGRQRADAFGSLTILTGPLSAACGLSLQAVDVSTCAVSNVVVL